MASSSFACLAVVLLVGYVQCQDAREPIVQPDDPERVNRFNPFPEDEFGRDRRPFDADQPDPACINKVMDIFFILDSSSSIYINDYNQELQFVQDVIRKLDINPTYTRVGALTFSDDLERPVIDLNRYSSKRDLLDNINIDDLRYRTGITNTHLAIRYVRQNNLFRNDITKVIVVITDGGSRSPGSTAQEARLAREEGFYVFVVGIGQYLEESEWRSMATDPDDQFVYNITNFRLLNSVSQSLPPRACSLQPIIVGSCAVSTPADVIFASTREGSQDARTLFEYFEDRTRDQLNQLRVSAFIGNCKAQQNVLVDEMTCEGFPSYRPPFNFASTLDEVRNLAENNRATSGNKQIAVIFLDNNTFRQNWDFLRPNIDRLVETLSDVIIVTMNVRDFAGELGRYQNVIEFNNRPDLESAMQRRMLDATCDSINAYEYVLPN